MREFFIKKRSGEIETFQPVKIINSIEMAARDVGQKTNEHILNEIQQEIARTIRVLKEENIIDNCLDSKALRKIIIDYLKDNEFFLIQKSFEFFRNKQKALKQNGSLMSVIDSVTNSASKDLNIKRENANIDTDTAMGTMLKYGTVTSNYYVENFILPTDIAEAHIDGDIHIHDKDFYCQTATCCQIDLDKLYKNGFSTGHGYLREPASIRSYAALSCIALQSNQNEMHGGQSIPAYDFFMAPGVRKTFRKEFFNVLKNSSQETWKKLKLNRVKEELYQLFDKYLNYEILDTNNYDENLLAFYNVLLEKEIIDAQNVSLRDMDFYVKRADEETEDQTYQAMESVIHNLNSMHSRAGAQVPFSSINLGTDISRAGRCVSRNFLLATEAGLGHGETPIFPVSIWKLKAGVNYNQGDPNYDLFLLAMRVSAKRLFPNFSFLDAPHNKQYYKDGDPNTEVCYMGCRTRVIGNIYDPDRETTFGRGNLSFTTINLPRLAILANSDINKFFSLLKDRMEMVKKQLLHRFEIQGNKYVYNFPFLMGQGIWLDSEKLNLDSKIKDVLKHGSLSIGFIGLSETLVALCGYHHGESETAQKLGLSIIKYMRDMCNKWANKMRLNFTLLATPAEGISGRFAKIDKEKFGVIPGVTDKSYYTNSFHVTPKYNISIYDKIRIEAPYHELCNAGHISYVELDGAITSNLEAFKSIIDHMYNCGIGYGAINHPVDRDPVCGYTGIIGDECPCCGRKEIETYKETITKL